MYNKGYITNGLASFLCKLQSVLGFQPMASVVKIEDEAAEKRATILAIGTANPANCIYQQEYPDFYFRVTNSDHMTQLKHKFKRICEKSKTRKRHLHLTEDILKANPNICSYNVPSFDTRQELLILEVPKLGKQAALKAIQEWGQPISKITHLIFCTTSGTDMPGADFQLTKLLGLNPSVNRFLLYQQGCYAGGTALRLAKDLAENNSGARVLVVCSEITAMLFHGPTETHLDVLVGQALFADGAAAVIVGANPDPEFERPAFQIMSARQSIVPDTENGVVGHLREMGLAYYLSAEAPKMIGRNIEEYLAREFCSLGVDVDWNSLFYIVHPGGPAIIDQVEENLGLKEGKLRASRHVLSEFGNMGSPSVLFVLDEMRRKSVEEGQGTTGEGLDWGVLFGIGPGVTVETVVLRSFPIHVSAA